MIDPRRLFSFLLMPVLPEGQARPTPLHVLSSKATQEVLERLCADHQRSTGQPVHPESIGGVDAARRVRSGEPLEVVVLAAATIGELMAAGHLLEGGRVHLASPWRCRPGPHGLRWGPPSRCAPPCWQRPA